MSITAKFTEALIAEQKQKEGLHSGYTVRSGGNVYEDYLCDRTSWKQLREKMLPQHVEQYSKGSGGELKEENGHPPKMAAFASSSRMIYTLSAVKNHIPDFRFEEQLPTTVGGIANLDGYLEQDGKFTFVEAKCREPYGHSVRQAIKQNYREIYDYLRTRMPRVFTCVMENIPDGAEGKEPQNKMNVVFFCHGKVVAYFDIKQMISHLLGIATKFLTSENDLPGKVRDIHFLYLLFDPSDLQMEQEDKAAVMQIYQDTCWCAEHYHFAEMFGHIVDFLAPRLAPQADKGQLETLKKAFQFDLRNQNDYMKSFQ